MSQRQLSALKGMIFQRWKTFSLAMGGYIVLHPRKGPNRERPPLFLLSMPRSGSTWIGRVLSAHPDLHYHFEPFNPTYSPLVSRYHRVRTDPEYHPRLTAYLGHVLSGNAFSWMSLLYQPPWRYWTARGVLIKDVHALFSLPLLSREVEIVLLVRHPCGMAESYVRRGLEPPLAELEEELREVRPDLSGKLRKVMGGEDGNNPWFRMGAYWELGYGFTLDIQGFAGMHLLRFEDLSSDPLREWALLLERLGLKSTSRIRRIVRNSVRPVTGSYTRRDSRKQAWSWKERLQPEEVASVQRGVRFLGGKAFDRYYGTSSR